MKSGVERSRFLDADVDTMAGERPPMAWSLDVAASLQTAIVERLLFGLVNAQLYGPGSARVVSATNDAASLVSTLCTERGTSSVRLEDVDGQVVFDGRTLLGASLFAKRLLERIRARGAGGVVIQADVSADALRALLAVLVRRGGAADLVAANEELRGAGATGVRFEPRAIPGAAAVEAAPWDAEAPEMRVGVPGPAGPERAGQPFGFPGAGGTLPREAPQHPLGGETRRLVALHQSTVDQLQELTISVCQGREIAVGDVGDTVERMLAGLEHDAGYLHGLAQYPEHDFFTFGHSIRVALLALDVARHWTTDRRFLSRIGSAALLHDIGMALISWDVLHKRGPLTADERREIEKHPVLGAGILLALKDSDPLVVAAAYGHHRQDNERGYPADKGELEQGVVTRLVTICDVFEALTAVRPYKPAMSTVTAYRTMVSMRGAFDGDLLGQFIKKIGIHPGGTSVELDDGSTARVVRQTEDLHRPVVEMATKPDGSPIPPGERRLYDLTRPEPGGPTRVRGS